jgi:hypothetical protein
MKMRRVVVTFEVETDVPIAALRAATLFVSGHPGSAVRYVERNTVNVIRASAKPRKAKGKR